MHWHRSPTVAELAERIGTGEDDVLKGLESAGAYSTLSLDAPQGGESDGPSVLDMPGAEDDALEGIESREALNAAPDRERRILLLQFFAGMTQSQSRSRWVTTTCTCLGCFPGPGQAARSPACRRGLTSRWVCGAGTTPPASQLSSHSLRRARLAMTAWRALR